jgi:predicted TPR repeat methyltransferase
MHSPSNPLSKTRTLLAQGNLPAARRTLEQLCAADAGNSDAWKMLSAVCAQLGDAEAAVACLRQVVRLEPDLPEAHFNLGNMLKVLEQPQEAIASFRRATELRPDFAEAHVRLGMLWHSLKRFAEAEASYREAVRCNPGDEQARFLLSTLDGTGASKSAPREYVARLFDSYADSFDEALVAKLEYKTPEHLNKAVRNVIGPGRAALDVLDLGCGTGLCGPLFRDIARTLVGVDLSEKMLAKARERRVYDDLRVADVTMALRDSAAACDLVLAADVFVYVGDLAPVFDACRAALRPGGLFAFSLEAIEDSESFVLRPTARYAHSAAYIRRLAEANGMREAHFEEVALRKDAGEYIRGYMFVLVKS